MRSDRLVRRHLRSRYLVTMASGEAFEGVLIDADDQHIVLADSSQILSPSERQTVDGHLWLPRSSVQYMQQPKV